MKYKVLIFLIFISNGQLKAQKSDLLANITGPTIYYFNTVRVNNGVEKEDCNAIIFGLPRSENLMEYYNENFNPDTAKTDDTIDKDSIDYEYLAKVLGSVLDAECRNPKILRINNYRNTQSSLDLNVQNYHMGTGILDSGERCTIGHSIDMKSSERFIWVFVGENMNVKYSYSEY